MYKKLEEFQKSKLWNGFYTVNGYFISFCGIALTCVIFAAVVMRYCFKLDFFGRPAKKSQVEISRQCSL